MKQIVDDRHFRLHLVSCRPNPEPVEQPMSHRTIKIQFVGGPFDGHSQAFTDPPILKRLALPVTDNTLPLLQGKPLGPPTPIATVARYQLGKVGNRWEYHFVESVTAKDIDLEGMVRAARGKTC